MAPPALPLSNKDRNPTTAERKFPTIAQIYLAPAVEYRYEDTVFDLWFIGTIYTRESPGSIKINDC